MGYRRFSDVVVGFDRQADSVTAVAGGAARIDQWQRRRLRVGGVVQGVGFRPYVHRLATRHGLAGFVLNDGGGVTIEVEGPAVALEQFAAELVAELPPLASVSRLASERLGPRGERSFRIEMSSPTGARSAPIPPDVATCDDCLRELFDPMDRRYRYPFINCTQCGPRFTIVRSVPYDRPRTTMADFALCDDCRREYEDPSDRRFHAEPIACPACGPKLALSGPNGSPVLGEEALGEAIRLLRDGAVVAVKGLGGYHLACDATSEAAVARLRERKRREEKPLALMSAEPERLVRCDPRELELLRSPARPIVLARRRLNGPVAPSVAPGTEWLGVMLPYAPLHHLLCGDFGKPLVMTSGNLSDEPIAFENGEAHRRLSGVADAFLEHDRPIHRRCEDSVVRSRFPLRRSRGFAPATLPLPVPAREPILATGGELKSTFALARGDGAFLSPHLGDLDDEQAYRAFLDDVALYLAMLELEPALIACDMHPDYLASKWAREQEQPLLEIQHHHAHAAACLAEHGESGPALALVFDGTGFGSDGTIWGGELLRCDLREFERLAWLDPVPLPGGEAAVREPWRTSASYLERAGRPVPWRRWQVVRESLKVNAPLSSGAGRLFDAVSALLGVRERISYEGQAAIELEQLAGDTAATAYPCRVEGDRILGADLVAAAYDDLQAGRERAQIAAAFHEGLAEAAVRACAAVASPPTVVLSGGSFQNLRLLESVRRGLEREGFRVLAHRLVPPNDGGISYGQAAVAAARGSES
jgi:hydrogenase maturation protein HypF